jgi:hypothetical protein
VKPGDVFKWEHFPDPQFGQEIKSRWFIYLGHTTTPFENPILAHICTTTTNIEDFKKGGRRFSHRYFCFQKGKYPFEQECVLDFDEEPYNYKKEELESHKDITILGSLDIGTLRRIYEEIYTSRFYSRKIKLDIRESFGQIGLTSLQRI